MNNNETSNKPDQVIARIIENYQQNEKALVNQLHFKNDHGPTIGGFREDIWKEMFEQIVPKKFSIEQSVFIMDSHGRVSKEVDLAIFDETYTPYIFRYGRIKFLPIEAVAVVVECKSTSIDKDKLEAWAESIAALKTSRESYVRMATKIIAGKEHTNPTQSQTRPLRVLCRLNENIKSLTSGTCQKPFDIIVSAPSPDGGLTIFIDPSKTNLKDWYLALNHTDKQQPPEDTSCEKQSGDSTPDGADVIKDVKIADYQVKMEGNEMPVSLLSLNLQLNQLLMLINNPIPFPHKAYAQMFSGDPNQENDDAAKEDGDA